MCQSVIPCAAGSETFREGEPPCKPMPMPARTEPLPPRVDVAAHTARSIYSVRRIPNSGAGGVHLARKVRPYAG